MADPRLDSFTVEEFAIIKKALERYVKTLAGALARTKDKDVEKELVLAIELSNDLSK
jgi:hypothetical protein